MAAFALGTIPSLLAVGLVGAAAAQRWLEPIGDHLADAGLGHVSEIFDGDPPHTPRGCPFQAWSLAELLRLDRVVLSHDEIESEAHRSGAR